jgi:hypothetical protein
LPIEWNDDRHAIAVGEKHAAAQSAVGVVDTIENQLAPTDVSRKKGPGMDDDAAVIELNVPAIVPLDTTDARAPVEVSVRARRPGRLVVRLVDCATGQGTHRVVPARGGTVTFYDVTAGTYQVVAAPERPALALPTVHDYVLVMPGGEL